MIHTEKMMHTSALTLAGMSLLGRILLAMPPTTRISFGAGFVWRINGLVEIIPASKEAEDCPMAKPSASAPPYNDGLL